MCLFPATLEDTNRDGGDNLISGQLSLPELQGLDEIIQVERRLEEICRSNDRWTPIFADSVIAGGKRLRPALVVLCGSFLPAQRDELIDVAVAVELVHTASLIHDDVIDRAALRRGRPTVAAGWGEQQAVLYGDFLFARAFSLLTGTGWTNILHNLSRAISLMCEGEIEQYARRYDCQLTEAEYLVYLHKKTAYFMAACCQAGGQVCGLPAKQGKLLADFGLYLGYAFQLRDDLLDFCGTPATTGKPVFQDLAEGYLTLPVILLLQHPVHGPVLRSIIARREFGTENFTLIRESLESSGIFEIIREKGRTMIHRAKRRLMLLPDRPPRAVLARLADHILP